MNSTHNDTLRIYRKYMGFLPPAASLRTGDPRKVDISFLCKHYDSFLLDAWGTLHIAEDAIDGAREFLDTLRKQGKYIRLLTNAASRPPEALCDALHDMGLDFGLREIICSGKLLEALNQKLKIREALYLGKDAGVYFPENANIKLTNSPSEAVVILSSYVDGESVEKARAILKKENALLVVLNPDVTAPDEKGESYDVSGTLAFALQKVSGCQSIFLGKPFPAIYAEALRTLIPTKGGVLCVGDTLGTDVAGAVTQGLDSALVFSGNTHPETLREEQYQLGIRPDYILDFSSQPSE